MQEVNIFSLIKNANAEIVIATTISCLITFLYNFSHKLSSKQFFVMSFIIGTCVCFLLSMFLYDFTFSLSLIKNAISAGTLSVTVFAFIKRFAFIDGNDVKSSLEKLLSSIILSDNLDQIVDEIINSLTQQEKDLTVDLVKDIFKENTDLSDDEIEEVCQIVITALKKHK